MTQGSPSSGLIKPSALRRSFEWDAPTDLNIGVDPMAHWLMGHGRAFFEQQLHADKGTGRWDLSLLSILDVANPIEKRRLQKFGANDWLEETAEIARSDNMRDPRVFPMPVRRALSSGDQLGHVAELHNPIVSINEHTKFVVGIVDQSICLPHHRFRDESDGSRILAAWHQSGAHHPDSAVPFGKEFAQADINTAIETSSGNEDAALRALGLVSFGRNSETHLARRASHGTHVLDLAAGAEPGDWPEAPPIIAVDLPAIVTLETTGSFMGTYLISAVDYILTRARQLAPGKPVIINFSFALSGGPRRGAHPITRSLYALFNDHQKREGGADVLLVMAAGNRNLAQSHAWQDLKDTGDHGVTAEFAWKLQPGDVTANMLDLWISPKDARHQTGSFHPEIRLQLIGPDGVEFEATHFERPSVQNLLLNDQVVGQVMLHRSIDHSIGLSIILAPTDPQGARREPAPPGEWTLRVRPYTKDAIPMVVEAWVMRDDLVPGIRAKGRQSYLIDWQKNKWSETGERIEWDSVDASPGLRHGGNLNVLSLDKFAFCVGAAMLHRDKHDRSAGPSPYSSGPLPNSSPLYDSETVDLSAISDLSKLRPGILAAGTSGGARVAINGTSVAAPQIVRAIVSDQTKSISGRSSDPRMGRKIAAAPDDLRSQNRP